MKYYLGFARNERNKSNVKEGLRKHQTSTNKQTNEQKQKLIRKLIEMMKILVVWCFNSCPNKSYMFCLR